MALKQVWMSQNTRKRSRYGLRVLGGIAGTAALMLVLAAGGAILITWLGLPRKVFSLVLVCGVTVLATVLGLKVGWRSVRDATLFFLTEDDRLYVMDARNLSPWGHGPLGYAAGAMETQTHLRRLAERTHVPGGADEMIKVEGIKENGGYYAISCLVRRRNGRLVRNTCFLVKGNQDEDQLLQQLERRRSWKVALEPVENRWPFWILASGLALAGFAALCVLSHPGVAQLPEKIYFPCLGGAFLALCVLVYALICQRRGH